MWVQRVSQVRAEEGGSPRGCTSAELGASAEDEEETDFRDLSRPWQDLEFFSEIKEPFVGSDNKPESYFKKNILAAVQKRLWEPGWKRGGPRKGMQTARSATTPQVGATDSAPAAL